MKHKFTYALAGALSLSLYGNIALSKHLQLARDVNAALNRRVQDLIPCSKAVEESRRLLQLQLKLRNHSREVTENDTGKPADPQHGDEFLAGLY